MEGPSFLEYSFPYVPVSQMGQASKHDFRIIHPDRDSVNYFIDPYVILIIAV